MHTKLRIIACAAAISVASAIFSLLAASDDVQLCVMTFNLRYAAAKPPNSWPERRPVMRNCIRQVSPDVIGTQEGLYPQLKDLAADLPEYDWVGLGRDGGSRGEFMAVFYRRERLEPVTFDHFWLSDTPAVIGSSTWGNSNRRMVTWVRFRERITGREFYVWNTHFDHQIEEARQKAASLVLERVRELNTDLPVFLTGDFNSPAAGGRPYEILVNADAFKDTWALAPKSANEKLGTFHNFSGRADGSPRIDWILVRGEVVVSRTEIITCSQNGQYPSDHFPVVVWMVLKESP